MGFKVNEAISPARAALPAPRRKPQWLASVKATPTV